MGTPEVQTGRPLGEQLILLPVTKRSSVDASPPITAATIASTCAIPVFGGTSHARIGVGVGTGVAA